MPCQPNQQHNLHHSITASLMLLVCHRDNLPGRQDKDLCPTVVVLNRSVSAHDMRGTSADCYTGKGGWRSCHQQTTDVAGVTSVDQRSAVDCKHKPSNLVGAHVSCPECGVYCHGIVTLCRSCNARCFNRDTIPLLPGTALINIAPHES